MKRRVGEKASKIISAAAVIFISCASFVFAQDTDKTNTPLIKGKSKNEETVRTEFQRQAQFYRKEGLRLQESGDLDGAFKYFQKSVELDPSLAEAHNDIGIILESYGLLDRAEAAYLEAVRLMPQLASPYSNLALLYEGQGKKEDALIYWGTRAGMGKEDDPWRKKAQEYFNKLIYEHPELEQRYVEMESSILMDMVEQEKKHKRIEDQKLAQEYYESSRLYYKKADYPKALEDIGKALSLGPDDNLEKIKLKAKIESRLQGPGRKRRIEEIKRSYNSGLKAYEDNNQAQAENDFSRIIELIRSPIK